MNKYISLCGKNPINYLKLDLFKNIKIFTFFTSFSNNCIFKDGEADHGVIVLLPAAMGFAHGNSSAYKK